MACRIPVGAFVADRAQRRCLKRNADLRVEISEPVYTEERFDLYRRYLQWRHPDGGMDDAQPDDFSRFLYTPWSPTRFVEFRLGDRLLAVAVTDYCDAGLSAVYTFYDPVESGRGLGSFAILRQIELARQQGLSHVYLGFWIAGHAKMDYKIRFQPIEVLHAGAWQILPPQVR